jgi:surface protein
VKLPVDGGSVADPNPGIECAVVWIAVNGVEVTPQWRSWEYYGMNYYWWNVPANEGDVIHAIFDWTHAPYANWFSEIKQFGLNSETGKRNQIAVGVQAFAQMHADASKGNPPGIDQLDTSNLTDMKSMFEGSMHANPDISGWDTSKVKNMSGMFYRSSGFNQDLSQWCVPLIDSKPDNFDEMSLIESQPAKQPKWGTCPRGEDGS